MISRMTGFYSHERAATGSANFVVRDQLAFDNRATVS